MTNPELVVLKRKLEIISGHIKDADRDMEKMRSYFKYQNGDMDSLSEELIVGWQGFTDVDSLVEQVEELIELND